MTDRELLEALEFAARHMSSDWPKHCQEVAYRARAALAAHAQQLTKPLSDDLLMAALRALFEKEMRAVALVFEAKFETNEVGDYRDDATQYAFTDWLNAKGLLAAPIASC